MNRVEIGLADIESARALAKQHDFRVGVVRIHHQDDEGRRHPVEEVLTAIPGIQWLAIVDRDALVARVRDRESGTRVVRRDLGELDRVRVRFVVDAHRACAAVAEAVRCELDVDAGAAGG